jgi:hypothetical protein
VRGIWLYLYLVIDAWSRKVVAWDVAEREDPTIAANLVNRACLRERISKGRKQPLILHADNGNAMRAATLESRLEELGVLRSFSRPRVSNDNPYSESLFRTVKYRPDYPRKPFSSKDQACQWVAAFVAWYNHQHRHSGIKFVTPQQRHGGQAVEICRHRAVVYEQARGRNPRRWSRSTRCWRQPEVVWINQPTDELNEPGQLPFAGRLNGSPGVTTFLKVSGMGKAVSGSRDEAQPPRAWLEWTLGSGSDLKYLVAEAAQAVLMLYNAPISIEKCVPIVLLSRLCNLVNDRLAHPCR